MSEQIRLENSLLPGDSLVPIRTVSSLTGVNPVTLRAWERRYDLIKPVRTPKGHRLYSMADVDLINQVVTLLEGGMSISQVQQVISGSRQNAGNNDEEQTTGSRFDLWQNYQHRLMTAITAFDEISLNGVYNEILALYPIDVVTSRLIVPLLRELGWRWQRGRSTGIAEEHFFSVFLRNKLGARLHHCNRRQDGPRLLAACMPGEQHDVGLMLFTLVALDWNYRVVLLGANMPLDQLALVVERTDCDAIILAGSARPPDDIMRKDLPGLIAATKVPVFIGGRIIDRHARELLDLGARVLNDDFQQALRAINNTLGHTNPLP
jgi:MerR family transcriptional regulator, light-induced transcriptional regulator